jgi:hypothetical protein
MTRQTQHGREKAPSESLPWTRLQRVPNDGGNKKEVDGTLAYMEEKKKKCFGGKKKRERMRLVCTPFQVH